jgi:hypothetical protein
MSLVCVYGREKESCFYQPLPDSHVSCWPGVQPLSGEEEDQSPVPCVSGSWQWRSCVSLK